MASKPKLHYARPRPMRPEQQVPLCQPFGWRDLKLTSELEKVTCKLCLLELPAYRRAEENAKRFAADARALREEV